MLNLRKKPSFLLITSLFLFLFFLNPLYAFEIYPPFSSSESETSKCDFQTVSKVIDGDTFELSEGTKVRLTGVDTPETVDPRKDVQWFGKEASRKLKEWIEGKTVCIRQEKDKTQNIDKYGRLLRYVWIYPDEKQISDKARVSPHEKETLFSRGEGAFFVNAELIKQGYGFAYTKYPFQYLEDFRKYERDARENNRGLWNIKKHEIWEKEVGENKTLSKTCGKANTIGSEISKNISPPICPEDAINHIGQYKTVRFFVKKSYDSGKAIFLNSKNNFEEHDNFTAVIFEKDKNNFPPQPADFYWGKTIDVTGRIKEYKGRAEIILENNSQINPVRK